MGRFNYLRAKNSTRQKELYIADLVWFIAKKGTYGDLPMPSEIWTNTNKIDRRTADQIIDDLIKKCGGE